jgi:uncharacterized protein YndB with AHSA1/START domain
VTENEIQISAPPARVFAVLADPASYADWIVGTKEIRHATGGWPEPGSRIHHSVGAGPLTIDDSTEVLECERPTRLVLLAHLGPLGSFNVELLLRAGGDGSTNVTMLEEPVEGISRFAGPVGDAVGVVRNQWSLARLKELAET